jgi:CRISPR system Cascade subunit CasC
MKLIELHILQSFPVSCLNRDDVGAPKSAIFGGVPRARISSQCLKRSIREYAQNNLPDSRFGGERTKLIVPPLAAALEKNGVDAKAALEHATHIADKLAKLDAKSVKEGEVPQVGTLTFLSPCEIESIAAKVAELVKANPKAKEYEKNLDKFVKDAGLMDGADIALFGRMAASMPSLTLEGAAMFSHALSTHKTENDLDFFSAVDDRKPKSEDAGAGMLGTLEFNSAVYYRYAAVNLDLLADADHLGKLSAEERQKVVAAFIEATVMAVPGARKNSMNASVPPSYVLGIYKEKGQPVQLINAFEATVKGAGLVDGSVKALTAHHASLKETWGITTKEEVSVPDASLATLIEKLTAHVQ